MLFPTLEEVRRLSENYRMIPVFWEIPADHWSPLQVFAAMSQGEEHAFLLESISTPQAPWQRWSYIGWNSPFGAPAQELADLPAVSPFFPEKPELSGGFLRMQDGQCRMFPEMAAYDHMRSTLTIMVNLYTGTDIAAQYQAAEIRAAEIASKIEGVRLNPQYRDDEPPIEVQPSEGMTSVTNAPDSFELYRRLRSSRPAPYLYYVKADGAYEMGAADSPDAGGTVGFYANHGMQRLCTPVISVRYAENRAEIRSADPQETEQVLALMRSAKLENHDA